MKWSRGAVLLSLVVLGQARAGAAPADFYAYHTRLGGRHPADNGAGRFADIVVNLGPGRRCLFSRAEGYRPLWRTPAGRFRVEPMFPDADEDPHCYYTYARLMENRPDRIVVHWRYLPDSKTLEEANERLDVLNPQGITGVVHEVFTVYPDGRVEREVRRASGTRYQDWIDPRLATRQTLRLTAEGIERGQVKRGRKPPFYPRPAVPGHPVKPVRGLPRPAHCWTFDDGMKPHTDVVEDSVSGAACPLTGLMTLYKKGVSGTALALDGYYGGVTAQSPAGRKEALTVDAWVALDAYPYNTSPVAHQSKDFGDRGWYLGLDAYGHPLLAADGTLVLAEDVVLPLHEWAHVAATIGGGKTRLYVNGREVASGRVGKTISLPDRPILLGRNSDTQRCTDPVRGHRQNIPVRFGVQGLLDEVRLYDTALSPVQIKRAHEALRPANAASDLARGVLPGQAGTAERFGAAYRSLPVSEVWDRLWRDPAGAEIVVTFDSHPCSVVFWRGTNYAPNWVTDNNRWMADQSSEIAGPHGCSEHMADKQVRHCYSRLIENSPARVVVHWRYPCVDVGYRSGGPGNWTDEYYTIYPDGAGVRCVAWNGGGNGPGFQDIQFLTNPGESALDVMHLQALTLANLEGETEALTWRPPNNVPVPELDNACIEWLNCRSRHKVFAIYQGGHIHPWGRNEQSEYTADPFAGPWNHWPMHLVPSDGRYAVANDRVTHFAIGANNSAPKHGAVVLYGFTEKPIGALVPIARSWVRPPDVGRTSGATSHGYDKSQRAYVWTATGAAMSFQIVASAKRPVVNPCFVIRNWQGPTKATVTQNGRHVLPGERLRQGLVRDTDGSLMRVIWLQMTSTSPVRFEIR